MEVLTHRDDEEELNRPTTDIDIESGLVVRSLFGEVYLRTNDISDGEGAKHGGGGHDSFGGPGRVEAAP